MSDEETAYEATIEVTRGTSVDDRDKIRVKVAAPTVDQLNERVRKVREEIEEWADGLRDVQPTISINEDQSTLGLEGEA